MRRTVNLETDLYAIAKSLAKAEELARRRRGRLATRDSGLAALHHDVAIILLPA